MAQKEVGHNIQYKGYQIVTRKLKAITSNIAIETQIEIGKKLFSKYMNTRCLRLSTSNIISEDQLLQAAPRIKI